MDAGFGEAVAAQACGTNQTATHTMGLIVARAADSCDYALVVSGDSCASLVMKCGITAAELTEYNPSDSLCSLPDLAPQPNEDGTCYSYTVQSGDYRALLAEENYITTDDLEDYNGQNWGWMGCSNLQLGSVICLSSGDPPMPAAVSNAVCAPQVEGTERPSDWDDLSSLNPCPLNACCNFWGQCGIAPEFCTVSESETGAPGTSAPGENGCTSNCGIEIVNNNTAPTENLNIGYFETFGVDHSCLAMDASQLPSAYSHVHFAFGQISTDFNVNLAGYEEQCETFANQTYFKRILSFGGWSFSTDLDSYPIFREGVIDANRLTFAQNVVEFVERYNLDGVDLDWEYPGAPGIPGAPPGNEMDGPNYLSFLKTGFSIAEMTKVLDYIVYMAYDLHDQWDYDNSFVNPGCPDGNCLRSHVNLTETEYALAMITKVGVPANKIAVGIASYGRSFGMEDSSCTGPDCFFTGPNSTAVPGDCTATAGYISQAELEQFTTEATSLRRRDVTTWYDSETDSDMTTYGDGTWVAYITQSTKASRINRYANSTATWMITMVSPETLSVLGLGLASG
ncbi:glycoside hydrolase superfamily [Aspergillus filifer]